MDAARKVAAEQGLPDGWLNDHVSWIPVLPAPDVWAEVLFDSPHLVVTGASACQTLAVKVYAARARDLKDVKSLALELGIRTMVEGREVHRAVFPYDTIPWRTERRVRTCLRDVWESWGGPIRTGLSSTRDADGDQ